MVFVYIIFFVTYKIINLWFIRKLQDMNIPILDFRFWVEQLKITLFKDFQHTFFRQVLVFIKTTLVCIIYPLQGLSTTPKRAILG
jgi:hypothetical protein